MVTIDKGILTLKLQKENYQKFFRGSANILESAVTGFQRVEGQGA